MKVQLIILHSVYPLNDDLYAGRYGDNGYIDESDSHSEDSNSETHWRNEYPDEDDEDYDDDNESIGEREMRRAVNNIVIGKSNICAHCNIFIVRICDVKLSIIPPLEDDLSDDSIGSESASDDDVNRYGVAYAKYKKRVLKQHDYFNGVIDDDCDYISDISSSDDSD